MTLEELKQVKTDFDNGIMVSRATWARVLDAAIKLQAEEDAYIAMAEKNFQND